MRQARSSSTRIRGGMILTVASFTVASTARTAGVPTALATAAGRLLEGFRGGCGLRPNGVAQCLPLIEAGRRPGRSRLPL